MGFSFSATWPGVYGDIDGAADKGGPDVMDAASLIAQKHPGGVPALAKLMGVSANTLQHKLNPNNTTHHLTLREAVLLQQVSGLPYVLHAMAGQLDHVAFRSRPDCAEGDGWEAFRFLQQTMGDLTSAAADVLHTESKVCSANDLRRVLHDANEAMAAITALVNVVASRVPVKKDAA